MKTLYFADADNKQIAYSVAGERYTGYLNVNLVATDPFVDVVI